MASAQAEPCHQPKPRIGLQPRRLFPNLERVPQRLKPDFRPVLTARLRFAEAVPLQNLRKPRNTPANLDSLAACCALSAFTPARLQSDSAAIWSRRFHNCSFPDTSSRRRTCTSERLPQCGG